MIMSSSSDSSGSESDNDNSNNASFDIGAIKKKYATPAATKRETKTRQISGEKDDEYDLEDSFIDDNDDDSESDFSDEEVRYRVVHLAL